MCVTASVGRAWSPRHLLEAKYRKIERPRTKTAAIWRRVRACYARVQRYLFYFILLSLRCLGAHY